jgi:hypothetical protein
LYNEYLDGRKIPAEFENFSAANELVQWLLKQAVPGTSEPDGNITVQRRLVKK